MTGVRVTEVGTTIVGILGGGAAGRLGVAQAAKAMAHKAITETTDNF
jgi:hypothetical protein